MFRSALHGIKGRLKLVISTVLVAVVILIGMSVARSNVTGATGTGTTTSDSQTMPSDCVEYAELVSTTDLPDGGKIYTYSLDGNLIPEMVPPAGWNPLTASDDELKQYGPFFQRPSDPTVLQHWTEKMSHIKFTGEPSPMCKTSKSTGVPGSIPPQTSAPPPSPPPNSDCDESLWNHVYRPERLQRTKDCQLVTGTVTAVRKEKDGDYHILLKLDDPFASMLNQKNIDGQHGNLVLEPICQVNTTQEDAKDACADLNHPIAIPSVGNIVAVKGDLVLDTERGWNELHPVYSLLIFGENVSSPTPDYSKGDDTP